MEKVNGNAEVFRILMIFVKQILLLNMFVNKRQYFWEFFDE